MGTSKSYGSPKWPGVNKEIGAAVSTGFPTSQKIKSAIGTFTKEYKNYLGTVNGTSRSRGQSGNRSEARARAAISGANLARFISTSAHLGLHDALKEFNLLDFKDKPLDEFIDLVAERLSSDGGLLDDDAINRAMADTLDELTENIRTIDEFDALLTKGNVNIEVVLQVYYANILSINFEQKEYSVIREKISREKTEEFFKNARDIIRAIVRDELSKERDLSKINWNSIEGQNIADQINQEVLEILIPHESY
jgi:hypothetical protein